LLSPSTSTSTSDGDKSSEPAVDGIDNVDSHEENDSGFISSCGDIGDGDGGGSSDDGAKDSIISSSGTIVLRCFDFDLVFDLDLVFDFDFVFVFDDDDDDIID
jgi:hypothetical protein